MRYTLTKQALQVFISYGDVHYRRLFSPPNFTVYSRVFLIPHPGVLISMLVSALSFSSVQKRMYGAVKS